MNNGGVVVFGPVLNSCACDCNVEEVGVSGQGFCVDAEHEHSLNMSMTSCGFIESIIS